MKYNEALDLVNKHIDIFFEHFERMYYWKACMESLTGNVDKAFSSIETILNRELCIPGNLLEGDPDLSALRGSERFKRIVSLNNVYRKKRISLFSSKLKIPSIQHYNSEYTIYYLHGNTRNGGLEKQVFLNMTSLKETIYFPDAPEQSFFEESYLWDDEEISYNYIVDIIEEHKKQFNKKIILAGFSRGARTALKIVYEKRYPVDGVIAFAPAIINDIDSWSFLYNTIKIPIEIIVGKNDELSYKHSEKLCDLFRKGNIPIHCTAIERSVHEYPSNFDKYFIDALHRLK